MGTHPAPGVSPEYDELYEDTTGSTPSDDKPEPLEVRVLNAVRTEPYPPRTVLTDQVGAGVLAVRLVGEQVSREAVTITATADVFVGGPGVTLGTGYLIRAGERVTLTTTAPLWVIAAAPATVYTLTTLHEG